MCEIHIHPPPHFRLRTTQIQISRPSGQIHPAEEANRIYILYIIVWEMMDISKLLNNYGRKKIDLSFWNSSQPCLERYSRGPLMNPGDWLNQ